MFGMNREEQKCQVSLLFDAEILLGVASMALHLPRPPCRQGDEANGRGWKGFVISSEKSFSAHDPLKNLHPGREAAEP